MILKISTLLFAAVAVLVGGFVAYCHSPYAGHIPELHAYDWGFGCAGGLVVFVLINAAFRLVVKDRSLRRLCLAGSGVASVCLLLLLLTAIPKQQASWKSFRYKVNHLNPNIPGYRGQRPSDLGDRVPVDSSFVSLNQVAASEFSISITNPTSRELTIEQLDTRSGGAQFLFEVIAGNELLKIERRNESIRAFSHGPQPGPMVIPPSGNTELKVDLSDFSWCCTRPDNYKNGDVVNWESIRVIYSRSHALVRSGSNPLVGDFHSDWTRAEDFTKRAENQQGEVLPRVLFVPDVHK